MKKKLFPVALLALVSGALSGCPVYDDEDDGCFDDYDCSVGYYCDGSGACLRGGSGPSIECSSPNDCAVNETCGRAGICAEGNCHFPSVGCVRGFECSGRSGSWECVREGSSSGGSGGAEGGGEADGGEPATPPNAGGAGGQSEAAGGAGGAGQNEAPPFAGAAGATP